MHCSEWTQGVRHMGVRVEKIHFNLRYMQNFMNLEKASLQQQVLTDHTCQQCACGICGEVTHQHDPEFWTWRKSGKGYYYTERCYARIISASSLI